MTQRIFLLGLGLALAASLYGCGDDTTCGAGTMLMGDTCVAACGAGTSLDPVTMTCIPDSTLECAEGTVEMGGVCVPDGSVICTGNTVFEPMSGTCVVDPMACADGTVFVDGSCVPFDSTLLAMADNTEGMEPNDPAIPGAIINDFDLGALDETVSFGGCVVPMDWDGDGSPDPDADGWAFTTGGPTYLEITIDGIGGLSAGFTVQNGEDGPISQDGWARFGIDLTSDGVTRDIFIPGAGTWVIQFADARSLLTGEPAGGTDACYFAQITRRMTPAATTLPADLTAMGTDLGTPQFYEFTANEGQLLLPRLAEVSDPEDPAVAPSVVILLDNEYQISAAGQAEANAFAAGLSEGQTVTVVMDAVFDYSFNDSPWIYESNDVGAQAMPTDGSNASLTHDIEGSGNNVPSWEFLYFDIAMGDVARLEFTTTEDVQAVVFNERGQGVGLLSQCTGGTPCNMFDEYFSSPEGGLYYLGIFNEGFDDDPATDGMAYDVAVTKTDLTPGAAMVNTPIAGDLSAATATFFELSTGTSEWVVYDIGSATNITSADVTFFNRDEEGQLGSFVTSIDDDTADGTGGFGRIVIGDSREKLVMIEDAGTHDGTETFDFSVADRNFSDLGTVSESAAIAPAAASIPPMGQLAYFLVRVEAFSDLTITAAPSGGEDITITQVDDFEVAIDSANAAGGGGAETLLVAAGGSTYVAFTVGQNGGTASNSDVGVSSIDPPYMQVDGNLPFTDVCMAGTAVTWVEDGFFPAEDDGVIDAPVDISGLGFTFFGASVTEVIMSTNGWMTFDGAYTGGSAFFPDDIPDSGGPNDLVAPFWTDGLSIAGCYLVEADKATFQWVGAVAGGEVQMQVVLNNDGSIDMIYGNGHNVLTNNVTVGIENSDGSFGQARVPLTSGEDPVLFDTSVSWVPRP